MKNGETLHQVAIVYGDARDKIDVMYDAASQQRVVQEVAKIRSMPVPMMAGDAADILEEAVKFEEDLWRLVRQYSRLNELLMMSAHLASLGTEKIIALGSTTATEQKVDALDKETKDDLEKRVQKFGELAEKLFGQQK